MLSEASWSRISSRLKSEKHLSLTTLGRLKGLHQSCYPIQINPCKPKTVYCWNKDAIYISNNLKKQISWGSGTGHGSFCCQICQISLSTIFSYYFHYSFAFSLPELYSENCWLANWVESCLNRPTSLVVSYVVKICCVYKPKPQTQTIPNTPGHLPQCHGNTSNINHFLHHQTPNKHICVYRYHFRIHWKNTRIRDTSGNLNWQILFQPEAMRADSAAFSAPE